jgi:hypothetical protein
MNGHGWRRLVADGTTVLKNGEMRVRSTAQQATGTLHVDAKTPAGYTRVAIDVGSGEVVAVTRRRTSKAAYDAMMAKLSKP